MNIYLFYILNIFLFAIPMALIEISIEKDKGWGGGFPKDTWYGKSLLRGTWIDKVITRITKFESPLNFHLVVMSVFHVIFILEYVFLSRNLFLILACYFGVNFFADLSWFSFNWYFDSLTQLLKGPKGSIGWHKSWVKIGKETYIPTTYPMWFGISLLFLILANFWR